MSSLETGGERKHRKRVVLEPLSRVEGHGKVTLLVDDHNNVRQARLHVVEFRGFEKFIQGRPYWEVPVVVQRLCGICPVSHHLAAGKAVDMLAGIPELTPAAVKLRRLLHYGQVLQSHATHFFHLSSPDLLFGYDDPVAHRNLVGLIADQPELASRGIWLRAYGQKIISAIWGKRIHGTAAIPGGMNRGLSMEIRVALLNDADQAIRWSHEALQLIKKIYHANRIYHRAFGAIRSNMLGLVGVDGALEIYDGELRASDPDGKIIFDHVADCRYGDYIHEQVKSWSYMKFPYIRALGPEQGWYRVGPLARVINCSFIPTPLAEAERGEFLADGDNDGRQGTLYTHWARMIELLHAAEAIKEQLNDAGILGSDLKVDMGQLQEDGIGVIEAPRGTLIHHYRVDENGLVKKANLVVSTTQNNQAMNESIRRVASRYLDGRELTGPLLNLIEVAIRAYDPCLSCATHAMGKMPLDVTLLDEENVLVDRLLKRSNGEVHRAPQA
jgi:NAD-reducing hydrogenase large subunit